MAQQDTCLGIDFGTSNSAAGFVDDGQIRLIEFAPSQTALPTTFFFDFDTRQTLIGDPANAALLDGREGRFMRALKRVLGTSLMHEKRQILNQRVTFVDIIAHFLRQIKTRAEAETGRRFNRALSGRPVVFHGIDDPREGQAQDDLRACYLEAGFDEVTFLPEPEAAAIAGSGDASGTGLVVDIGGGTSDFSVFRTGPDGITILANHGVRIGGTDFDRALSIDHVMPHLGKGTWLRKVLGPGLSPVPNAIFNDLATWEKIPFLYAPQTRRMVAEMLQLAEAPDKLSRLDKVLDLELGHDLAFAVEAGKIAANSGADDAHVDLHVLETGLSLPLSADAVAASLSAQSHLLKTGVLHALTLAGLDAAEVDRVVYVGGSSLMSMVCDTMQAVCPQAEHSHSKVFTAVASGLAMAASDR